MNDKVATSRKTARLRTPTSLGLDATRDISGALNALLADFFALYLKTKNFHWHVSGPHFRDYHLLLDEQADQLFATTGVIAEHGDVATASLLEIWIDEAERRTWFLFEASRFGESAGG